MYIIDTTGKSFLYASGGAIVLNVGHGRKEIAQAVYDQILQCDYAHPTMFTNSPVEKLAEALSKHAPPIYAVPALVQRILLERHWGQIRSTSELKTSSQ